MFKITPIQDKERQKKICHIFGAIYRSEAFAYIMYDLDTAELMGMSQFEISDAGYIYDLKEASGKADFEAMFILGRQTMNFIDSCGAHLCYADRSGSDARLLHAIGFREDGDKFICDTSGMFSGHCDCHK